MSHEPDNRINNMKFAPRPENDFCQFIRTYYDECRYRFDRIEAIAGKWMFRDLIPGMSDFDTRFILRDGMSVDDWCRMSTAIGEAHFLLCRKYPGWARNLEHLPGINLTWSELADERIYYPEYQQWSFYHAETPANVSRTIEQFAGRKWDIKDEYFHLKKFCLFYGRYDRKIDPPVNLGVHANKYALHSRLMHYFNPPVMSAVCLLLKKSLPGKFDAFEIAARFFPDLKCWEMLNDIFSSGYEAPKWYAEARLVELENELEKALAEIAARLLTAVSLIPISAGVDISKWRQILRQIPMDPALIIFENAKFSRLMKGRLWFYANINEHFDSTWLIQNELRRLGNNFFRVPFGTYWKIKTGETIADPISILDRLRGDVLTDGEIAAVREFARLTPGTWEEGKERSIALAICDVFDEFFKALTKISEKT